ncbi:hypothetical protein I4U23_011199 [Adineta vaga]|nr:hypothetical protein I4U23_011199 [Adineta vaga]
MNRTMSTVLLNFLFLFCCFQVQVTTASSSIKQQLVETVVPPYRTAYTTLNEEIVEKLLTVDAESDQASIQELVHSLICAAKNVHNQLHKATQATEKLRTAVDKQIIQLVLSVSNQEEQIRQIQEAIHQANNNIHSAQLQINMAQTDVHHSQHSLSFANQAVIDAEETVRQARMCNMGRRRKRFLGSLLRELNPVRIFRNVIGKPLCSVINSGGIDNAKERRALAQHNLHQAHERLHQHQQNLANQQALYHRVQAQLNDANTKLATTTSKLNEQRTEQSLITSVEQQLKNVEIHLKNVFGSSTVLRNTIVQLVDFDTVIEPLNNIYHEMLNNSIMESVGFEISSETTNQINTNLKQLADKLPQMPINSQPDSSEEEGSDCKLSPDSEESSTSISTDSPSTNSESEEYETRDPYAPIGPIDCPPLSNTYSVNIQSFSYSSDSKEFQEATERAKSKFYTCLKDPPAARPYQATFMQIRRTIDIDNQYTEKEIQQCNNVPECIQKVWITYYFAKA